MSKRFEEKLPPWLLSLICVVIGIIHFRNSDWKADWILVAFVVLCFVPWLGDVFESIGGDNWGAKYRKNIQGETSVITAQRDETTQPAAPPAAPSSQAQPQTITIRQSQQPESNPNQFLYQEMKVLATLWKHQKIHFPGSRQQRWTFSVGLGSPEYMSFSLGFLQLVKKGYADVALNNHQVMLTDAGYDFCMEHDHEVSNWRDTYDNFSDSRPDLSSLEKRRLDPEL